MGDRVAIEKLSAVSRRANKPPVDEVIKEEIEIVPGYNAAQQEKGFTGRTEKLILKKTLKSGRVKRELLAMRKQHSAQGRWYVYNVQHRGSIQKIKEISGDTYAPFNLMIK